MKKTPSEDYLQKAGRLGKLETERLLSRARNKLLRRLEDQKVSPLEAVAIQLELEDEALAEWRDKWAEVKDRIEGETRAKGAARAKSKAGDKPAAKAESKPAAKPAAKAEPKSEAKARPAAKVQAKAAAKGKAS